MLFWISTTWIQRGIFILSSFILCWSFYRYLSFLSFISNGTLSHWGLFRCSNINDTHVNILLQYKKKVLANRYRSKWNNMGVESLYFLFCMLLFIFFFPLFSRLKSKGRSWRNLYSKLWTDEEQHNQCCLLVARNTIFI